MKHLKQFNELRTSTYRNASNKLKKMGHKVRGEKMLQHSYDMEKREVEKYNVGTCTFDPPRLGEIKCDFIGFDIHMSIDCWVDSEKETFLFPVFFVSDIKDEYGENVLQPFSINYDTYDRKVKVESTSPDELNDIFGVETLLFNNRRDAVRMYNALKMVDFSPIESNKNFPEYKSFFDEVMSKLTVNMMWR